MHSIHLDIDDSYDKQCGEMILTLKGHIILHCSLCEGKFNDFSEYSEHVMQLHYQSFTYVSDEDDDILFLEDDSLKVNKDYSTTDKEQHIEVVIERDESIDLHKAIKYNISDIRKDEIKHTISMGKSRIEEAEKTSHSTGKHKCKLCGFVFTQVFNLRAHMRRHLDEKRFKCTQCTKAFHTRTEFDVHTRRHNGERPFICEECGHTFVTAGALTMHVKRHKDIRKYECPQCGKKFFDNYALKIHLVGHTGDRPYKCSTCEAAFSRKKALAVHKKIHENKREYHCKYCDSSFNQKPGLYSHIKIKHNGNIIKSI